MNKTRFETNYYYPTLRKRISFEVKSFLGRTLSPKIRKTKKDYLQLGSGHLDQHDIIENLDFYDITLKIFLDLKIFLKKIFLVMT